MNKPASPLSMFWLKPKNKLRIRLAFFVCLGVFLYFQIRPYTKVIVTTKRQEMVPTLQAGDTLYLYQHPKSQWSYLEGDIILAKTPQHASALFFRIIAQNKGQIEIKGGQLYLNGELSQEFKGSFPSHLNKSFPELKEGEVFCAFDNQNTDQKDSCVLGPFIQKDLEVTGKIFYHHHQRESKPASP